MENKHEKKVRARGRKELLNIIAAKEKRKKERVK
jgi:hypothetical protein